MAEPSATVVLLNDAEPTEILMVQRHPEIRFLGGNWVFPGGKVEATDAGDGVDSAYRHAACRELLEETGIDLTVQQLHAFSHWTTPVNAPRRFATWFYLARIPHSTVVQIDAHEIVDYLWRPPQALLQQHAAQGLQLSIPALVTLRQLAAANLQQDEHRICQEWGGQTYLPKMLKRNGQRIALLNKDAAYASEDLSATGPKHRLCQNAAGQWQFLLD